MTPASATVRAIICDVYGTLLKVGPAPQGAAERWRCDVQNIAGPSMGVALKDFDIRCASVVAAEHAARRAAGEPFPEVDWIAVVRSAMPGLVDAPTGADRATLVSSLHAGCSRTCTAMPGALAAMESLRASGLLHGIASNAQHYTRDELTGAGFPDTFFQPELCFFSGEHGFAKPSPRVFAMLTEKLAAHGIAPHETLMVGDSIEKDIAPAAAAGWQTWQIAPDNPERSWEQIKDRITRFR